MPVILLSENSFTLQAATGVFIAWVLYKGNNINALYIASLILFVLCCSIVLLVLLNLTESKIALNLETSDMQFTVTSKNYWGMWHPNIISSLITSCSLIFYFFEKKKLYICSLMLLLVVATETLSRTYLVIPLLTLPLLLSRSTTQRYLSLIKASYLTLALTSLFISLVLISPNFLSSITPHQIYYIIDSLLSYRLSIFNNAINELSVIEYFFGSFGNYKEVDSFFINLIVNHGIFIFMIFFLLVTYGLLKKQQSLKTVSCIAVFLLVGNFEDISGSSSLPYLIFCISIFFVMGQYGGKKNDIRQS